MVVIPPMKGDPNAACIKAVRTAMRMAWCIHEVVEPSLRGYDDIDCGIGIAYGRLLVVKAGIGGKPHNNDLVWVGRPANLAAKLSDEGRHPERIWIDEETYNRLDEEHRNFQNPQMSWRQNMWQQRQLRFADQYLKVFSTSYMEEFH